MESALGRRDQIGVQDFVLLEEYRSEEAFMDNLRKRFRENLIYVSQLLVTAAKIQDPSPLPPFLTPSPPLPSPPSLPPSPPDLYWLCGGVCQSLQDVGYL